MADINSEFFMASYFALVASVNEEHRLRRICDEQHARIAQLMELVERSEANGGESSVRSGEEGTEPIRQSSAPDEGEQVAGTRQGRRQRKVLNGNVG